MKTVSRVEKGTCREVRERIERCIATMVYYHKDGGSWAASGLLAEEARSLSAWCATAGRDPGMRDSILGTLKDELTGRFGDGVGRRVHEEFLRALDDAEAPEEDRHPRPVASRRPQRASVR